MYHHSIIIRFWRLATFRFLTCYLKYTCKFFLRFDTNNLCMDNFRRRPTIGIVIELRCYTLWPERLCSFFQALVSMTTELVRCGESWLTWRCWSSCLSTATCLRLGPGFCTMYWPGPATSSSSSGQVPQV